MYDRVMRKSLSEQEAESAGNNSFPEAGNRHAVWEPRTFATRVEEVIWRVEHSMRKAIAVQGKQAAGAARMQNEDPEPRTSDKGDLDLEDMDAHMLYEFGKMMVISSQGGYVPEPKNPKSKKLRRAQEELLQLMAANEGLPDFKPNPENVKVRDFIRELLACPGTPVARKGHQVPR